jgi:hypothetical protein
VLAFVLSGALVNPAIAQDKKAEKGAGKATMKENIAYKTGEVRINEASPAFTTKNIGKSEVKLYIVQLK